MPNPTRKTPAAMPSKQRPDRARIFTLEVSIESGPMSDEFLKRNEIVSRTIAIRDDQPLALLHIAIFHAFNRHDQHLYDFRVGESRPRDPDARRYTLRSEMEELANRGRVSAGDVTLTTLADLALSIGDTFRYWFDFGDDWWHIIKLVAISDSVPRGVFPRVTNSIGESPPQYLPIEDEE